MRLISAELQNFASYANLSFSFNNLGLCLINGSTGSGKSTLCDVVPWILFGRTAKNGPVDEIVSWGTKDTTRGTLKLLGPNNMEITVTRTRKPNDLLIEVAGEQIRGKDLPDTQFILNQLLGIQLDTYLSGAYFHEFSQAASFFTAPAKVRRAVTDQLIDLSFYDSLASKLIEAKKVTTAAIKSLEIQMQHAIVPADDTAFRSYEAKSILWEKEKVDKLSEAQIKYDNFEVDKQNTLQKIAEDGIKKMDTLHKRALHWELSLVDPDKLRAALHELAHQESLLAEAVCPSCGTHLDATKRMEVAQERHKLDLNLFTNDQNKDRLKAVQNEILELESQIQAAIESEKSKENKYLETIFEIKNTLNPYFDILKDLASRVLEQRKEAARCKKQIEQHTDTLRDIEFLQDRASELRAALISSAIEELEVFSNRNIDAHFGGEFRVEYLLDGADKLEVIIQKDGHECSYTQLSKGQRQILKLTFALAVMELVSMRYNVQFNTIFLDEALDGLDSELKIKAYGLLTELANKYENVLVVEHSTELKGRFSSIINVSLVDGKSQIEKT